MSPYNPAEDAARDFADPDTALKAGGYATGLDVWDVLDGIYGNDIGDSVIASAQLWSLREAVRAEYAAELAAEISHRSELPGRPAPALGRHEDDRGVIQDLLAGPLDMVTQIDTRFGHVRGNHVHQETAQWTYVVSGRLLVAWQGPDGDGPHQAIYPAGSLVVEEPGIPHAWQAVEDTRVLVFTRGPRAGMNYESDTQRLPENARLLP